ncbi:MAG: Lrp/AsnC family transcriptional regulator [Phycisphaerae bacterium]
MNISEQGRFDSALLDALQRRFPLIREPYAQIGEELGIIAEGVIARVKDLRESGVIREIAGIFDAQALGYRQALVMMRVPEGKLDAAGAVVAGHPGVSHCYGRTGRYNLWFTLAVSPQSRLGLEGTVQLLADRCAAEASAILPTIKRYKLEVNFRNTEDGTRKTEHGMRKSETGNLSPNSGFRAPDSEYRVPPLTDEQVRAIRALQIDLPAQIDPFSAVAAQVGMTADDLLVHAADFLSAGWMRRYAAVLHHRAAGAEANVLVAWQVAGDKADAAGAACSAFPAVSHCYLRPPASDWPYALYTMVHGRTGEECSAAIARIAAAAGLDRREELWTVTEYKKQRIKLLTDDEARWEAGAP